MYVFQKKDKTTKLDLYNYRVGVANRLRLASVSGYELFYWVFEKALTKK